MMRSMKSRFYGRAANSQVPLMTGAWLAVSALLLCSQSAFGFQLDLRGQALFKQSDKSWGEHEFVSGKIDYIEDEFRDEEGYAPQSILQGKGPFQRRIYDHAKNDSAIGIAATVNRKLSAAGYSIVYSCEKAECGDVEGWQLYLSDRVAGDKNHQFYFLARKDHADTRVELVSVYVNEFTGRPRTIIDTLSSTAMELGNIYIDGRTFGIDQKQRNAVFFEFNRSDLTMDAQAALSEFSQDLDQEEALLIIGHTDAVGSPQYNQKLSEKRADSVKDYLVGQSVSARQIFVRGDGATVPVASNSDEKGRAQNRRTVVYRIAELEKQGRPSTAQRAMNDIK